jgi:hypothetical protein
MKKIRLQSLETIGQKFKCQVSNVKCTERCGSVAELIGSLTFPSSPFDPKIDKDRLYPDM